MMALASKTKLGPYEILDVIGAGGMGEVYRARDTRLGREVAIKILPQHLASTPEARQRFEREARAVSSLNHPNICTLHDIGHQDGTDFLVMECLDGETLAKRIARGPLEVSEAVNIALQVARGLAEAHSRGVIHRDIKPSNIILTRQGVAKIVDFGLARAVESNTETLSQGITGTINYMAPEQALGRSVDARADVWALGVVLMETLSGRSPFRRDSASASLFAVINEPPGTMPNVSPELQKIIYRALAKDPAARYSDCRPMLEDLETFRSSHLASSARAVDPNAPTTSIRGGEFQQYVERASASAWPTPSSARKRWSRWWLAAAIPLVLIGFALALSSVRARIARLVFGAPENHVAVLPFENIGNNPANAPLAEGLMDSLSGALSNLDIGNQSLWVVPSSVVRARKVDDPSAALRQLGATLVVQGSIEREGQDVHLTVNLINAKTLRQIGSAQLEDPAGDMATLQDEAVSRLANLMGISVTPDMLKNTGGKANPAAYQSYLTALGYIQRYDKPGNLDLAITSLNAAVKTDPSFALGYGELGEAYRLKYQVSQDPQWLDEASANCAKAVQLNDHLPAVYVTLGRIHDASGKHDLAVQEFQHALQLDPHSADALSGMARAYENAGRIADAEKAYQKAAALHPDYWDGYNNLSLFYDRHGMYQQAIASIQHAIELTPDNAQAYSNLGSDYLDTGDPKLLPDAEQALKKSIELSPSYPAYANLGLLYYNERRFADSAAMTEKALALNNKNYRVWSNLVASYEWLKEDAKAAAARGRELALVEDQVERQPQDAVAQSELADIYAGQKMRDKALIRIQSALALSPDDAQVLVNVGVVYEALGDRPHALYYVEKALQKGYALGDLKSNPDLQSILSDPNFRPSGK
ncbi:MAG TPA: protein kinase [Candidatus Acidoferrales bacterium]|nr:protein kinase [Candidatus Acidoferrales bacterium]